MSTSNQEYERAKDEARRLRGELAKVGKEKEQWFSTKEELKTSLHEAIAQLKTMRGGRDKLQEELQKIKAERDKYNKEVQRVIAELKVVNTDKTKKVYAYQDKVDLTSMAKRIDRLEQAVEIETDFKKEQKFMEQIRKLKKSYDEQQGSRELAHKSSQLIHELRDLKKKADAFHRQVQTLAQDPSYAQFLELSKKITQLKKTQEEAFSQFVSHKNKYQELYKVYRERLKSLKEMQDALGIELSVRTPRVKESSKSHKEQEKMLAEKNKEVEEKIKKGAKLTNEDLLVFQGKDDS